MNLGIDISQLAYKGTGVGRFTTELTENILKYDTQNSWTFFFSSFRLEIPESLKKNILSKGHQLVKLSIPPTILSLLWNRFHKLNIERLTGNLDWFITSDWTEPPTKKVKKATIIHDLVFLRYPETVSKSIIKTQTKRMRWVEKESDFIITDSNSTKQDVTKFLKIKSDIVKTIYPGVNPLKITSDVDLSKYKITKKFILTVGKLEPRKNIKRLIDAFLLTRLNKEYQLVIVGMKGWGKMNINNKSNNIIFTDYVPDNDLYNLYKKSSLFVFPSLWEGFGIPLVEAMQFGCPSVISNTSSLKEIGGDAVIRFDPYDVKDMAKKIEMVIRDKKIAMLLSKKGKIRSKMFQWKRYLDELIKELKKRT